MKEFTITNIFKCWLKMWPITIILIIIGLGAGWLMSGETALEYSAEMDLLIIDERDGSTAAEYAGLANSDLVSNPAFKKAAVDDGCTMISSGNGDIIAFVATCPTSEDEAKHLAETAADNFTAWAQDIYGEDNFKTVNLSENAKEISVPGSSKSKRVVKLAISGGAMLVVSFVIAFIYLDYKVSKGNGKKA